MKRYHMFVLATTLLLGGVLPLAHARQARQATATDKQSLAKLIAAVQQMPDSLRTHQAYLEAAGLGVATEAQYKKWMAQFPHSAMVPFAIGNAFADRESPKAKPYLLKAVAMDPKMAEAWGGLWIDAERWGDFAGGEQYLKKATEADPNNAAYAFYYANSFDDKDSTLYRTMSLEVARRFPEDERGAQSLYWLAVHTKDPDEKIKLYELLKTSYAPVKFSWSSGGMGDYYELLLDKAPDKALALATEMAQLKFDDNYANWPAQVTLAQEVVKARSLQGDAALAALSAIHLPRYSGFRDNLLLLKAEANAAAGRVNVAYDSLMTAFIKSPSLELRDGAFTYGAQLGKNNTQVMAELYQQLLAKAKPATPFTLKRYLTPGSASLSDFKGKVVLLTYWFPGCGPCRGEFPHFQHVINKYKGKAVDYVGINIESEQNAYVRPFMQQSGYSFTPLEEVKGRAKGNMDNHNAAPANFLIDQQGRLFFADFRISEDNEALLEMMIDLLLTQQA